MPAGTEALCNSVFANVSTQDLMCLSLQTLFFFEVDINHPTADILRYMFLS